MKKYTKEDEDTSVLVDLIKYAGQNPKFNSKFVDDCYEFIEKYDFLTENQIDTLFKIYHENNVDEYFNDKDLEEDEEECTSYGQFH